MFEPSVTSGVKISTTRSRSSPDTSSWCSTTGSNQHGRLLSRDFRPRFGPVVGIDNHKATTSFVIRVDKPGNQVINDLTPQVQAAALELTVNSQSSNQERRIRTRMLCIGHLVFQAVPRRLGNHCRFDAVMHRSERNRLDPHRRSRTRTGRYSCRWGKGCNQMLNGFFPLWASL